VIGDDKMNNRIGRINEDIQRELAELIRAVKDPRVRQGMLSITGVDTTGDLRYAKVYVSILGDVDEKELKKGLKSAAPWLRRELGGRLSLRYTPELIFERDSSIANGAHISELLSSIGGEGNGDAEL
jgi:ribosome-binding factor A